MLKRNFKIPAGTFTIILFYFVNTSLFAQFETFTDLEESMKKHKARTAIVDPQSDRAFYYKKWSSGKWGYQWEENTLIEAKYDSILIYENPQFFIVSNQNKWGLLGHPVYSENGNLSEVFMPLEYDSIVCYYYAASYDWLACGYKQGAIELWLHPIYNQPYELKDIKINDDGNAMLGNIIYEKIVPLINYSGELTRYNEELLTLQFDYKKFEDKEYVDAYDLRITTIEHQGRKYYIARYDGIQIKEVAEIPLEVDYKKWFYTESSTLPFIALINETTNKMALAATHFYIDTVYVPLYQLTDFYYDDIRMDEEGRVFFLDSGDFTRVVPVHPLHPENLVIDYSNSVLYDQTKMNIIWNDYGFLVQGNYAQKAQLSYFFTRETSSGYIDSVISVQLDKRLKLEELYDEEMAVISINGKQGKINNYLQFIENPLYDKTENYFDDFYFVYLNQKIGLISIIDKDVVEILPIEFEEIETCLGGDLWKVKKNGKYGIYSRDGLQELTPCIYDQLITANDGESFYALKEGKWGLVTFNGIVVKDFIYNSMQDVTLE